MRRIAAHFSLLISTIPPERSVDTSASNNSYSVCLAIGEEVLVSQDQNLLSILEQLKISGHNLPLKRSINISATRITGYFCFDTVFNLINRILIDIEIKVLEKGLYFAPIIQRKIYETELMQGFAELCRRMCTKGFFINEPTILFSEVLLLKTDDWDLFQTWLFKVREIF